MLPTMCLIKKYRKYEIPVLYEYQFISKIFSVIRTHNFLLLTLPLQQFDFDNSSNEKTYI